VRFWKVVQSQGELKMVNASEKCFLFRSGENVLAETGHTTVDAWGKIVERAKTESVPAWMRVDRIEAWSADGQFHDVMTWDERTAELDAVLLFDSQMDCETCDGAGVVEFDNAIVTDRGTKWQRTAVERLRDTCPTCDGARRVMSEAGMFSGPG
jgi:hypothetical protein